MALTIKEFIDWAVVENGFNSGPVNHANGLRFMWFYDMIGAVNSDKGTWALNSIGGGEDCVAASSMFDSKEDALEALNNLLLKKKMEML